ncbi:MAG: MotA/TolQ/ExbB proton channel family protein [Bacteroidales bacterium]|nr:MotA/TolQ/ExbB proton channel family protein [Bacteroidales bacterium]
MFELFYIGGPLFMGILTFLFFIILAIAVYHLVIILKNDFKDINESRKKLKYIKSLGLFAFVTGIMGQLLGLYNAFGAIEKAMDISPALLAGGLKVSMITPIYGALIFVISYLLWIILDYVASNKKNGS